MTNKQTTAIIDPKMLELLVCPRTRHALEFDESSQELVSKKANLAYPVRDGVPILLISEARALVDMPVPMSEPE